MTDKSKSFTSDSEGDVILKNSSSHLISREQIKSRYGDLIDSLPIIIYIVEPHPPYSPIYVSKGIEMLGYTQEDWNTLPDLWVNSIHEDDRERVLKETRKAIGEQREADYEYRMRARDGSVYWFHDKGHFVRNDNGELVSWEGFLLDITERKNSEETLEHSETDIQEGEKQSGNKTILLVEDEEIIREMIRQILLTSGYKIVTAGNGIEALKICETGKTTFDLLITDLNMPQMNGRELAEKIRSAGGAKKVLYISGYTDDDKFLRDIAESDKHFIAKPFSPEILTVKVREILDKD